MEGLTGMTLALAQGGNGLAIFGAVIGCGMIIIGAGFGISLIGGKALESQARQPENSGRLFQTMIIAAALIEGVTFFALLVCFLAVFWSK
ncbi:MAG: ATP synthase F0 subunit C [Phycisphaerae bacterium]|jgi:F-type H+-transporting ATPase subunit c